MRINRRRAVAAVAGLLVVAGLTLGAVALVRYRAAGVAHPIAPPEGAVTPAMTDDQRAVIDRGVIVALGLRNDRGDATVRSYELPAGSPWLRSRQVVATQLDHWEQIGDCADRPEATIVECAWREPTRWWPREVTLTMLRLPAKAGDTSRPTFVVIGSGLGE
ncbi:hypothetical protein [Actinoplanes sp. NPDC049265]|uniref:hypothetical protein n=1 Tax=Actinoplanes sp. NPDC049265 TaxID=3363902 RepID=UPI003723452D